MCKFGNALGIGWAYDHQALKIAVAVIYKFTYIFICTIMIASSVETLSLSLYEKSVPKAIQNLPWMKALLCKPSILSLIFV